MDMFVNIRRTFYQIVLSFTCDCNSCRMTLLLGPPSSGKTTLLLALAGRLGKDLKVRKIFIQPVLLLFSSFYMNSGLIG